MAESLSSWNGLGVQFKIMYTGTKTCEKKPWFKNIEVIIARGLPTGRAELDHRRQDGQ
ncbi:hypothetical protein F442_12998 [Phytophthora nicotianae P10297]|uniref:Uncharacterized protein n=2 Tax=Phytophthora nicotianae TaxID=4792 RepID=W2YZZ5_PHYNI|nr:hypothetical protein L915_12808 [Phytophthora nicotianae]ETP39544.1 hypothetical protein F442_12998 [Phytophthora nicotianae P10297]